MDRLDYTPIVTTGWRDRSDQQAYRANRIAAGAAGGGAERCRRAGSRRLGFLLSRLPRPRFFGLVLAQLKLRLGSWNNGDLGNVVGDGVLTISCSTENHDCCEPAGSNGCPGCNDEDIETCVCDIDPFCCDTEWDEFCILNGEASCGLMCP